MKTKYRDLIQQREDDIRKGILEGYLKIYILGHFYEREFAVIDGRDVVLREKGKGPDEPADMLYREDSIHLGPKYDKIHAKLVYQSQIFTLQELEYILSN